MVTEPLGDKLKTAIDAPYGAFDDRFALNYFRPLPGGRLLWGGNHHISHSAFLADSLQGFFQTYPISDDKLKDVMLKDMLRVFPQLKGVKAEFVRTSETVVVSGAETKRPQEESAAARLSVKKLSGIVEYEPSEYTFTALAGTSLSEIEEALCANGQYLPFDPPLVGAGATLGGTVASGLSGPGRLRYGGLRDFLIGARFINGAGQIIQGGGKVVKNAAGFDYPKLLCGSMSTLGAIVETTFKVFPRPRSKRTLELTFPNLDEALEKIHEITISKCEPDALELIPTKNQILLRLAGNEDALTSRIPAILEQLKGI